MFKFFDDRATLIAEIGGNHEGSINKAKDLMFEAAENGADIIKFQSYSGPGLVNKSLRPDRFEHFEGFMLSDDQWIDLAETAVKNNIHFSSSLWEDRYFNLLDKYISLHKVGSGDLNNFLMIKKLISTKKPLVLSSAMSSNDQLKVMYDFVLAEDPNIIKENRLGILQCTAMYDNPSFQNVHLSVLKTFKDQFDCMIGFSNHAVGINPSIMALALGAKIIEFHYTSSKDAAFRDHKLSFNAADLKYVAQFNREVMDMHGDSHKKIHYDEQENTKEFRRGIFLNSNLKKGSIINHDNLTFLRPEEGISLWDLNKVIGKKLRVDVSALEPLSFEFLD